MKQFIPYYVNRNNNKQFNKLFPFSKDIKILIHQKHRKWTRLMETKSAQAQKEYKIIRNKVRAESRKIIKKEQTYIARCCKDNPKKFWKYVNSKTSYKTGVGDLSYVDDNGDIKIATDDQNKAEALVKLFSSVFTIDDGNHLKPHRCVYAMDRLVFEENDMIY